MCVSDCVRVVCACASVRVSVRACVCVFTVMRECMVYLQVLRAPPADHEDQSDPNDKQKHSLGAFVPSHVRELHLCVYLCILTIGITPKVQFEIVGEHEINVWQT